MAERPPEFSREELRELAHALNAWALNHPDRDRPVLAFADGSDPLSPLWIAELVGMAANGKENEQTDAVVSLYARATLHVPFRELIYILRELSQLGREEPGLLR